MARSSERGGHTAPHPRHDRIGAILLDIAVIAFVDKARLAVVAVVKRPVGEQVVVQRRATRGATARGFPAQFLHHGGDGFQPARLDQAAHILMGMIAAFADRRVGIGFEAIAKGQRHHLFDKPGTGATGRRGLGLGAHEVEGRGPALNRVDDLAFAHAVTATDFRIKRQGCNGRQRVRLGTSLKGRAKDQRIAHRRDVAALLDQAKEPGAIGGVAIHHRPQQTCRLR